MLTIYLIQYNHYHVLGIILYVILIAEIHEYWSIICVGWNTVLCRKRHINIEDWQVIMDFWLFLFQHRCLCGFPCWSAGSVAAHLDGEHLVAERAVDILAAALQHNSAARDKVGILDDRQGPQVWFFIFKVQNGPFLQSKAVRSSGPTDPVDCTLGADQSSVETRRPRIIAFIEFVTCSVELFGAFIELTWMLPDSPL